MCDFNRLDEAQKLEYQSQLKACADAFGGVNYFLQLLEAIRKTKPHPLVAKNMEFRTGRGTIKWEKVIFQDKLSLLLQARQGESERGNLLPDPSDRKYKKVLNLAKTLHPITFVVQPKNLKDGDGFTVHAFDRIDDTTTRINPMFDALFFCAVDTVKKILAYTPKA
jgi:hypothetical protein